MNANGFAASAFCRNMVMTCLFPYKNLTAVSGDSAAHTPQDTQLPPASEALGEFHRVRPRSCLSRSLDHLRISRRVATMMPLDHGRISASYVTRGRFWRGISCATAKNSDSD